MKKNILFFVAISLVIFLGITYLPFTIRVTVDYITGKDVFMDANNMLFHAITSFIICLLAIGLGLTCLFIGINNLKKNNDIALAPLIILLLTAIVIGILSGVLEGESMIGNINLYRNDISYGPENMVPYYEGKIVGYIATFIVVIIRNIAVIAISALPLIIHKKQIHRA